MNYIFLPFGLKLLSDLFRTSLLDNSVSRAHSYAYTVHTKVYALSHVF